jgi:hypothetical protein
MPCPASTSKKMRTSGQEMAYCMSRLARSKAINVPEPTSPQDMATCFAGSEDVEFEQFPMKTALVTCEQAKDKKLQKKIRESWRDYTMMKVEDYYLLSYQGKFRIPWKVESLHVVPQTSGSPQNDAHGSNATFSERMVRRTRAD